MKGKHLVVALGVIFVLVLVGIVMAYLARLAMDDEEEVKGPSGVIPKPVTALNPVLRGPADWPCWRGPRGDGKSIVTGIRKDWSGGLRKLWDVDYLCQGTQSVTWSAPAIQGNRLVVPGRNESNDLVFCLDPNSGAFLWLGSYEAGAGTSHGPGARATPYIDDDRVYTFGRSGDLVCWRLEDGQLLWRHNVSEIGGKTPRWGHSSSPLVCERKVFVQGGGSALAVAYDKITGELVWKAMEGEAGYAAPALIYVGDKVGLLIFHGMGLACLDPNDGSVFWSVPWETRYQVNATTPAMSGTTVFITSGYETGCQALRVGNAGADILWTSKVVAAHHSDPIVVDDHIYGYSGQSSQNRGHFKCVKLDTGQEQWSTREVGWGTTVYVDGHLLCMDIKGNLFLVEPDPGAFRKVTEFKHALGKVKHTAWTIPVIANGKLYLRYMQRLVCYRLVDTG